MTNLIIILDFETGGLTPTKNPITEIAALAIHPTTLEEVGRYQSYVKPTSYPKFPLDTEPVYEKAALDSTGLSLQKLESEGQDLKVVVKEFTDSIAEWRKATGTTSYTKKPIFVCHNLKFDRGFLQQIFKLTKSDLSKLFEGEVDFYGNFMPQGVCSIQLSKFAWEESQESYTLTSFLSRLGVSFEAHRAMSDVLATKQLLITHIQKLRSDGLSSSPKEGEKKKLFFQF